MAYNQQQLIEAFINGETDAITGTPLNPGTLKIKGNQIIHYETPILERYDNKFILNVTRYSLQTGQVQKKIKAIIKEDDRIEVKQVPSNTSVSLSDYLKKE